MFFFAAPMSDSFCLLLVVSCLYAARRGRPVLAGLFGAYATFTRSTALSLLVPLAASLVSDLRGGRLHGAGRIARRVSTLLMTPLGFCAYLFVNYTVSGDPFRFLEYQSVHWSQRAGLFFGTAAYQTEYAVLKFSEEITTFFGLWMPNLLCCAAALLVVLLAVRELRPEDTLWFLGYYAAAIGVTWLLSGPRYLAGMPVLPVACAALEAKFPAVRRALPPVAALCSTLYFIVFVLRWQVW